jgi:hypothetical protein
MTMMASSFAFVACNEAPQEAPVGSPQELLCPEDGCGPHDPPDLPQPKPFYPARGWTVIDASPENLEKGMKWWAYRWDENRLYVKGYYPQDFGGGLIYDPRHVVMSITVSSVNEWHADTDLYLPVVGPPSSYTDRQHGRISSRMGEDGILRQAIGLQQVLSWGDPTEIVGDFEDDGSGAHLVGGSDTSRGAAAVATVAFLSDFQATGALLSPPDYQMSCDEGCASGFMTYFERVAAVAASRGDNDCAWAIGGGVVCAGGATLLALFTGPPGWVAAIGGGVGIVCGGFLSWLKECVDHMGERSSGGACVGYTGPQTVVGPDGSIMHVNGAITVNTAHCEF